MFDGTNTFWDLYEQAGEGSPFHAWRGQRQSSTTFDQGVERDTKRIAPMPIKDAATVSHVASIFHSPVVT